MFFDKYAVLCKEKGVSVYKACTDLGLNRSAVAKWKAGATPNGTTVGLMAEYFDVSTDYLLEKEQKKEKPTLTKDERSVIQPTDADIKFALFGKTEVDDETYESVKEFAKFAAEQKRKKREGK